MARGQVIYATLSAEIIDSFFFPSGFYDRVADR